MATPCSLSERSVIPRPASPPGQVFKLLHFGNTKLAFQGEKLGEKQVDKASKQQRGERRRELGGWALGDRQGRRAGGDEAGGEERKRRAEREAAHEAEEEIAEGHCARKERMAAGRNRYCK